MNCLPQYHRPIAVAALVLLAVGCATTDGGNIHVYSPAENLSNKEIVHYPMDPDNAEWIIRVCETGSFTYRDKDREFTIYGVVLKAIECIPRRTEDSAETQRSFQTFQYRVPNEALKELPEEVRSRIRRIPLPTEQSEQSE